LVAEDRTLVIIDSDDKSRSEIVSAVQSLPGVKIEAETGDFNLGMKLARQVRPAVLVVQLEPMDEALVAIERFTAEFPTTAVMATAPGGDAETVLKSVRAGAKEYLSRPVEDDEIRKAVDRLFRQSGPRKAAASKVISIFSNKGGTGTSTIAVNLAVALSRVSGKDVALADFDHHAGEVSLFLNLAPSRTVADLVAGSAKLDAASVQSALVKHDSGVFVLCEPDRPEQTEGITGPRIHEILEHLTSSFSYVVCDLSHSFNDVTLEVFDNSSNILVVTLLNLPAIRSSHRCIEVFKQLNYLQDERRVRMVVNRYLPNRDIDVAQLEETLHYPVYWKVPNDYPTVIDAVNSGLPIEEVDPDSEVAQCYRTMAADLAGIEIETATSSGGIFSKLLGRK
jgi:pilus assembly protein CpaE